MEKELVKDKKRKNKVWSFFASVRLAIILLIVIASASLLGTFIPQQDAAQDFLMRLPSGVAVVMQKLQLFDLYHSSWFLLLLGLLTLNLVVCSLNRLPASIRRFRMRPSVDSAPPFEDLPAGRIIVSDRNMSHESHAVEGLLRKSFRRVRKIETEKGLLFTGEKGAFALFGVHFVHMGILAILAGAITGAYSGFDGYTAIPEGETSNTISLKGTREVRTLPFTIRCDRFTINHYENGTPMLYRSDITLLQDGRSLKRGVLLVNHPMEFEGVRIHQASYEILPAGRAILNIRNGPSIISRTVQPGDEFKLPGTQALLSVLRVENDIMDMGPAVKIAISNDDIKLTLWIFQHIDEMVRQNQGLLERVPMFNPTLLKPFVFSLRGIESVYVTGLQVNRDPGAPVVAAGAMMMIFGIIVTFYMSHRRIYILVDQVQGSTRIRAAGRSNRDPVQLEKEIDRWLERYREGELTR